MSDPASLPLAQLVSTPRMDSYLRATAGDHKLAARLYMWNIEIGACLWGPISILEVLTRNAIHDRLTERFGTWYTPLSGCSLRPEHERRHVNSALEHLAEQGNTSPTSGEFVGATSFGLWVGLVGAGTPRGKEGFVATTDYDRTLWSPDEGLHRAFPHRGDMNRRQLHNKLSTVQTLRNRIAHHEPIHHRNHLHDLRQIVEVIDTIWPDVATFVRKSEGVTRSVNDRLDAINEGDCVI